MNTLQLPDENQFKQVLLHYKKFYISLGIIVACLFLIMMVIIPQIQQYSEQKAQVAEVEQQIAILQKNIAAMRSVNQEEQGKQLALLLGILPEDKDYAGILFAVKSASSKSNVQLGDFTFSVGELSAKSVITKTVPNVSMKLEVSGSMSEINRFLIALSQTAPLVNVSEIQMSSKRATLLLQFYYKPIPQLKINVAQPIAALPAKNQTLVNSLSSWEVASNALDLNESIESSGSASIFGQ